MDKRILVVDDDPELRELLRSYLGGNGFAVDVAEDGAAMRRRMAAAAPDLVILDLMLPGEDGLALCRELRAGSQLAIPSFQTMSAGRMLPSSASFLRSAAVIGPSRAPFLT